MGSQDPGVITFTPSALVNEEGNKFYKKLQNLIKPSLSTLYDDPHVAAQKELTRDHRTEREHRDLMHMGLLPAPPCAL